MFSFYSWNFESKDFGCSVFILYEDTRPVAARNTHTYISFKQNAHILFATIKRTFVSDCVLLRLTTCGDGTRQCNIYAIMVFHSVCLLSRQRWSWEREKKEITECDLGSSRCSDAFARARFSSSNRPHTHNRQANTVAECWTLIENTILPTHNTHTHHTHTHIPGCWVVEECAAQMRKETWTLWKSCARHVTHKMNINVCTHTR